LARDFHALALVARTTETLAETAEMVRASGAKPLLLVHDLRQPDAAGAVVAATLGLFGRIDAVARIVGAVPQADMFALADEQRVDGGETKAL
jgi:3-oxoacyl-[acyl-carrier protein] reductase